MEKVLDDSSERRGADDENALGRLRGGLSAVELQDSGGESAARRAMAVELVMESLEEGSEGLEERREFVATGERKRRKLASEEEELRLEREEFSGVAMSRKEELNLQLVSVHEWLQVAQKEVRGIRTRALQKLKKIEDQEQSIRSVQEALAERERKVHLVIEALDGRINAVEEREKGFNVFLKGKMRELELKEKKLSMKWEEFAREVKLVDEKYREQEKLRQCCIERLELADYRVEGFRVMLNKRLKEIEGRENVGQEAVEGTLKQADSIRESMEKQMDDFDKMRREFDSLQEDKMQELVSKEEQLHAMAKKLFNGAKLRNKQLKQKEKFGCQLLERLELALHNVEKLKKSVDERFKEIGLKEFELNSLSDWVERKMDEADSKAKELVEHEKRVKMMEEDITSRENNQQKKQKEFDLKKRKLAHWEKELEFKQREVVLGQELNEKRAEELDWKEKNLNSVKDFTRNCFKEHRAIKKQLQFERDAVEMRERELKHKEDQHKELVRELELTEQQYKDRIEEFKLKQSQLTDVLNTYVKLDSDESADIKFIVKMDGKTLQMFLNDPEKDLESMGDEIFKVLHLSPDPAKLVLDAMVGFYPPRLRNEDEECKVRKTCILLLEQLSNMSLKLRSEVREEAVELANEWKSKMRATAEKSLEVLGFLHLLGAYNLVPYFDKDDISRFLTIVGEHRQGHALYRVLGFSKKMAGQRQHPPNHMLH